MNTTTERIVQAWVAGRALTVKGSSITLHMNFNENPLTHTDGWGIWLRGNMIVRKSEGLSGFEVSDGGYRDSRGSISRTTRERLDGLGGLATVWSERGEQFLNGVEWDGKWIDPLEHVRAAGDVVLVETTWAPTGGERALDACRPGLGHRGIDSPDGKSASVIAARAYYSKEAAAN